MARGETHIYSFGQHLLSTYYVPSRKTGGDGVYSNLYPHAEEDTHSQNIIASYHKGMLEYEEP